ncbi:DoxX-like family protein [Hymenobacter sp. BT635]|uniref:DoxX-like family protein n=1 Tax=Hymenobacter nitidus TaxID=2880929 RepID=A0ABS8AHS5_9BACT|nr:DoxX-like family protein [Hymenobacter nitidus]MCB2379024.1 DoxX-like family protein [Hymenobacter nitidus]
MKSAGWLRAGLRYAIAGVWLANGLLCKVLHLVPRHETIVARILGPTYAAPLTWLIGLGEIGVAIWVLSGYRQRLSVVTQIGLVMSMNALEFLLAADLLLWHQFNAVFASLFVLVLYYYGFGQSAPVARSH